MCLSKLYIDSAGQRKEVMNDVAFIEAENDGYVMIDLFGNQEFVHGKIKSLDFVEEHTVVVEENKATL